MGHEYLGDSEGKGEHNREVKIQVCYIFMYMKIAKQNPPNTVLKRGEGGKIIEEVNLLKIHCVHPWN
jgi:hypothetical protein